ncbi:MAG: hypothetical protein JWP30_535 [Homoserinimonas sp.]|nr:hypothetical protein [Homoserinimonas sp.]
MEPMGHNSFAVTRGYQHVSTDQHKDAMERMSAVVNFGLDPNKRDTSLFQVGLMGV